MPKDRFTWDASSAAKKFMSGSKVDIGIPGVVSISKDVPIFHDKQNDAYRKCSACGKHYNYHKDGKCQ